MYPNLYTILVAAPGIGKTLPIQAVRRFWRQAGNLNVASDTITKAGLVDEIKDALRTVPLEGGDFLMFHSLLIGSEELTNLIPTYDMEFLGLLGTIYDCGQTAEERTRKHGRITVSEPHITLLGGTQPKYLVALFPDAAYGQGFASRLIMIHSNQRSRGKLWLSDEERKHQTSGESGLITDLTRITEMCGEFQWDQEAKNLLGEWEAIGCPPVPTHHRLEHYCQRRRTHLLKLSMIISAAESSALRVTDTHVSTAMHILFDAEEGMPSIFREMTQATQPSVLQDCFHWMLKLYNNTRRPITEPRIWSFLSSRMPPNQIRASVDTMIQSGLVTQVPHKVKSVRAFIPRDLEIEED